MRRRLEHAGFVVALIAWMAFGAGVSAQGTAQLQVKVVDQTGGVLPHATVAVDGEGSTLSAAATDKPGIYAAGALPPGRYAVTVEAEGFAPTKKSVDVRANRVTEVTVVLTLHTNEKIEVPGLQTAIKNSLTSMTLTGKDLALLPNNEIDLFFRLQELAGSRGRPGDVAIYVDGFREFRRLPPRSAIELIQINAEPYSAQFPEPGARRIEIITKPGGDGTFGELKSDFNDESLNAREPLGTSKPALQRRTVSGYFSAPIIPQRWGFYAYAGRWEQDENAVIHATTLDDALAPAPFQQTLSAPQRLNNFTINSGMALGKGNRLKTEYTRDTVTASNQGLASGLDLPERGIWATNVSDIGRFSLLSILGKSAVLEMRVQLKGEAVKVRAASDGTGIMVLDAFNGGANQAALFKNDLTNSFQLDTKLTKAAGSHTIKMGVQGDYIDLSQVNFANFGGTFVFGADVERDQNGTPILTSAGTTTPISPLETYRRTLLEQKGYHPTIFTITTGDPATAARQWQAAGYVQDDWLQSKNFTFSSGLRYEWQTNLNDSLDLAPRLGLAWSLGDRGGVVRAGGGVFYKRFDPSLTLNTIRLDGQHQHEYVVQAPTFFPPPTLDQSVEKQTVVQKADGLKTGRLFESNVGYERALFGPFFGSATYSWERGERLTRSTDINTPLVPGGVRPVSGVGQILEYQSVGGSRRHELQLGLRAGFNAGSRIFVNYTLASAQADTDDPQTLPADSRNLTSEWGPTIADERHRVYVSGTVMMPHFFMLIPSFTYATPRPFNITTGLDNNLDGHVNDRPAFASEGTANAVATPFGLLNPFPKAGDELIPRNSGRGASVLKFDLSFAKVFILANPAEAKRTLAFHLNCQNLLNTTNLRDYNGVLLSPLFNKPNTADLARRVSLGLAFNF